MATPQLRHNEAALEPGNLSLISNAIENEAGQNGLAKTLQIASVLQTTLNINTLIEIFSHEIKTLVPHDSMVFENSHEGLIVSLGKIAKHSCSYQLVAAGQSLGQLVISRRRKFTPNETILIEHLLCSLVYPLRNALMYKNALSEALTDPLTGLNNRAAMNTAMIREAELARRYKTPLSLIALDIDKFKKINDRYGHTAGDYVLKSVSDAIVECIRSSDIAFRYGGEEFTILLSNTIKKGALLLAERIRKTIETSECIYGDTKISMTASLGVTCFSEGDNSETLFEKADRALYRAKETGRNQVCFNTD